MLGMALLLLARLSKPHPQKYVKAGGLKVNDLIGPESKHEEEVPPEVQLLREVVERMKISHPNDFSSLQGIEEEVWKAVDGDLDLTAMSASVTEAKWVANHVNSTPPCPLQNSDAVNLHPIPNPNRFIMTPIVYA